MTHRSAASPVSPATLGRAALRIGARQAHDDTGLALAAVGLVLASMPSAPRPTRLPPRGEVAALLPPGHRRAASAILAAAEGVVGWMAAQADAGLALTAPAGHA